MTLKKTVFFGLLFLSTISAPSLAIDSIHVECSTCTTETQFYNAAKNEAKNTTRFINIMNFKNYELRKFRASKTANKVCEDDREPDGRGGFIQICKWEYDYAIVSAPITNEELYLFTDLADSVNDANKYYTQRSIEIPSTIVTSGYELIGAGYKQTKVTTYFNQLPLKDSILEKLVVVAGSASKIVSTGIKFEMPALVFTFSDGVKAYAEIDFVDMDDQTHFKFTKLIDPNGNPIDLTKSNPFTEKYYNFSKTSLSSWRVFRSALNAYDLRIIGSSNNTVPTGTVAITDCSGRSPTGSDTICRNSN
ncbi:hypothetical protein [Shewanella colwelliana]|uniref:hypothetical protein n=1 Tax=Shewanella colwelliana TaxID=23 RepID=UPI003735F9B0